MEIFDFIKGRGAAVPPPAGAALPPLVIAPGTAPYLVKQNWPTQAEAPAFYGDPADPQWYAPNVMKVVCPWPLVMDGKPLAAIEIHHKCAASLARVLGYIWAQVHEDRAKITALHYDRFSGSYVYRPIRGGTHLSMHSYAAALDFDDAENQQHTAGTFRENDLIVTAFEMEGWVWGGRWSAAPIDPMHFQAAKVR